ncbi:MAG: hydroxypyruvate isomerase [Chitinophagaceae bacterium]|nr:MAG: hydroxypyruvate isomerase [Chitinophagaceae bacterium]
MTNPSRRSAIKNIMLGSVAAGGITTSGMASILPHKEQEQKNNTPLKGNINHAVCRWCYSDIPLDQLCKSAKEIGIKGIDLVGPKDWDTLKKYDLYSSMCNGAELNLVDGFNDPAFHQKLIKNYTEMIPLVAKAGFKDLICFSGSRRGKDDETGLKNCTEGLKKLIGVAEKNNVTLVMELLNSKIDHEDYQCDKSNWGIELCKRIGSENFKLLYDIYHMQIDEGDVIRTINEHHHYFAHYHTGGVPGRNEINETQELYYPAIMKAIVKTGFKGFVAQEFIPTWPDPIAALKQGVEICDV